MMDQGWSGNTLTHIWSMCRADFEKCGSLETSFGALFCAMQHAQSVEPTAGIATATSCLAKTHGDFVRTLWRQVKCWLEATTMGILISCRKWEKLGCKPNSCQQSSPWQYSLLARGLQRCGQHPLQSTLEIFKAHSWRAARSSEMESLVVTG